MPVQTFPGFFESLERISEFIDQATQAAQLNPHDAYAVQLAVDEACTNIIEHGYGGEGIGDLTCTWETLPDGLKIILCDHAPPFDPAEIPEPTLNVSLDEIKPRGLGLYLMRKMMDEVHFEFSTEKGNVLSMIKRRK